ncbi:hypothetical protein NLI96_g5990 [Meripilus lineatus]|uniref:TAP42-like protein n=1 Tax=Meripilus lineatus TaxID=2056292 RepID=A0AAD5V444_9APHY|nr:hypothetical protein NLI96_g5990 [Physisporinus lineatus]
MDLPLPALFARALTAASKASNLPTIQDETQDLVQSVLADLDTLTSRIRALSLFSPNETLEDISTKDLVYLFVPFVAAEMRNRIRILEITERLGNVRRVESLLRAFLTMLETYEIVPESEKTLHGKQATSTNDPAKRRELKLNQWKKEKELKTRIEVLRKRRGQSPDFSTETDFDQIASLLPSGTEEETQADNTDSSTDEILRETSLVLLRLYFARAQNELNSIEQELELLRSMPPPPPPQPTSNDPRLGKAKEQDDMWKLDAPLPTGGPDGKGPLLDRSGKPLRPFTILPAGASDRARFQAQVFQPDHRLPTMTIDEYLEIEGQRGNIISGGGPQSEAKLTTSEQLALDSEMDGTLFGEEKAEEKRQKDETWAQYTDTHPKGAGNTMNRG